MHLSTSSAQETMSQSTAVGPHTFLRGRTLFFARSIWVGLVIFTLCLFTASLPNYFLQLQAVCSGLAQCSSINGVLTSSGMQTLHILGLSAHTYAAYTVVLTVAVSLIWAAVGLLIFWRKSDDWMALLTALILVTFNPALQGGPLTALALTSPMWSMLVKILNFLGTIMFPFLTYLFPNGKFVPSWSRWMMILFVISGICTVFPPLDSPLNMLNWPGWLTFLTSLIILGTALFSQVYRYVRVSSPIQRQQTKWVAFGIGITLLGFAGIAVLASFFPSLAFSGFLNLAINTIYPLVLFPIPVSIAIAMLRYRLWDIDILINRTLVYGALTACVVGIYACMVGYFSLEFQVYGSPIVSLLATGLVAVLFQPLRQRLQRLVNRLMYGERDDPYLVISRLGKRLEGTLAPDALLPTIVETVAQSLKLPYVAISLKQGEDLVIVASYGSARENLVRLPLVYQAEQIGELDLAPRAPGESFTPADRALLNDLAHQAGVAAHAVRLTADLKQLTESLQQARERLVTTREEERRRLRRDLHDGLGPTLGHLTLQLDGVRDLIAQDPSEAQAQVAHLKVIVQDAMNDIRRLVYALRPPALDELGLVTALREQTAQYHQAGGLKVTVEAPASLPPLPAAVEVAAYRIALEALTNVVRHAQARTCRIILIMTHELVIEIVDDGKSLPDTLQGGVGFSSMRERAAELGGTCVFERVPEGGTRVCAQLPLPKE